MSTITDPSNATNDQRASDDSGHITEWLTAGNYDALREHLYSFRPMLHELATNFGGPLIQRKVDRSDIVQETLQDAVHGLPSVKAETSVQFFAWLKALLENRIRRTRRHFFLTAKRDIRREVYDSPLKRHSTPLVDLEPLPEVETIELENLDKLRQTVACLPEELQLLLKWRFEEDLSYKEIAERIDRTPDAVRMLVNRCLRRIKETCFGKDSVL